MFVKIRKMRDEDISEVVDLCRYVRDYHNKIISNYFVLQNDEKEKKFLKNIIEDDKYICIIAETETAIAGFFFAEKKTVNYLTHPNIMNIFNFGVNEKIQRRGLGKMMLDELCKQCREENISEMKLGVFNSNEQAKSFYQKYGFSDQEQKMNLTIK